RSARNPLTQSVDVVLDIGVLDHRKLRVDLLRRVLAHLHFLLRGHAATGEQSGRGECKRDFEHLLPPRRLSIGGTRWIPRPSARAESKPLRARDRGYICLLSGRGSTIA